jgi:MFS family permease
MATTDTHIRERRDRGSFADGQADPGRYADGVQIGSFAEGETDPAAYQDDDRAGTFARGSARPAAYPADLHEGTFAQESSTISSRQARGSRSFGFWAVAFAFATVMAFTTVPTPLWSMYAQRDRFSSLTVTIAFAVYALAVALSLFLIGHLSDTYGRRRVLMPALALEILAGVVFAVWSSLPALLVARVLSGLGIGAVTATAMAWISELGAGRRRAQIVATAANLGGLGLGALISGVLAQWTRPALVVPFAVFTVVMLLAWVALLAAPETRDRPSPRPRYRPQRVAVPAASRSRFFAAALGAGIAFAVFGLLTSLAPSFLAGTLHQPSHVLAGAVTFAVFATAAVAQTLTASRTTHQLLTVAIPALLLGLGLLTIAVWLPSPSFGVFLAGDIVVGAGCGLMFKGAIGTVSELSSREHRAEALAGVFLACYLGLAIPVIGLGALTQIASTPVSMLVFAGLLALGILVAGPVLLGRGGNHPTAQPHPTSI